jgi:hypothetical protein
LTPSDVAEFEIDEVMVDDGDLLVLSLGFVSAQEPLDVLHFVSGKSLSGIVPRPIEDELYIERTDQSLACAGEVIQLDCGGRSITLALTEKGAMLLALGRVTRFRFERRPELLAVAVRQLGRMAAAGHANISISESR